jgi:serine/threonine protein kinase
MSDPTTRLVSALSDRYTIEREIGRGGMATVYLAEDLKHHRMVAVKVLRPELAAALGSERFLREIEITAKLTHPLILPVHDSGDAAGFLYYVMPYVEGGSLRDRLNREKQLPVEDALEVTKEIADALAHAHMLGFVHRDIKPENILFEAGHAVVSDFGIARVVAEASDERLTETGLAVGTPAYMSPEQGAGEQNVDGRNDIYSLACVLYEMLGGDPPYSASTPQAILARKLTDPVPSLRAVRETVPDEIEHVVIKALAKTPSDRFATATEFIEAITGTRPVLVPAAPVSRRRRRVAGWLGSAVAVLVILGSGALLGSWSNVAFSERDWIVIADLENLTGDSVFDQSLNAAFTIAVQQSRYVNVFPVSRVQQTLERMELAFALFDNQPNLESLAFCALTSGDAELARERYELLLDDVQPCGSELQESWLLAHYQLGRIYEEQGDTALAVDRYSQFLDLWKHGDDDLEPLIDARRRIRDLVGLER